MSSLKVQQKDAAYETVPFIEIVKIRNNYWNGRMMLESVELCNVEPLVS